MSIQKRVHFSLFLREMHTHNKCNYWILNWDIDAIAIHNTTLYRERQADKFLTYPVPEFNVWDKVLVRNHTKDDWNPKYDVAYCMTVERQLELMDESGKTCRANIYHVKIMYPVNDLMKCLPDNNACGCVAKYL